MKNLKSFFLVFFITLNTLSSIPRPMPFGPPPQLSPQEQKELESFFQNLAQQIEKEIEQMPPEEKEQFERTFGPRPASKPPMIPIPEQPKTDATSEIKKGAKKLESEGKKTDFLKPWGEKERKEHGQLPDFKTDAAKHYLGELKETLEKTQSTIENLPIYQKEKIQSKQVRFSSDMKPYSWKKVLENLSDLFSDLTQVLDEPLYYETLFETEFDITRKTIISFLSALSKNITEIELQESEDDLPPFESKAAFEALVASSKEATKSLFRHLYALLQAEVNPLQKKLSTIIKKSEKAIEKEREAIKKKEDEARKRHEQIIQQSKYSHTPSYPMPYYPQRPAAPYYPQYRVPQPGASGGYVAPTSAKKATEPETFTKFDSTTETKQSDTSGEQFLNRSQSNEVTILLKEEENIKDSFVDAIKIGDFEKADRLYSKLEDVELKLDKDRKKKESWKKTNTDFEKAYKDFLDIKRQRSITQEEIEPSKRATTPQADDKDELNEPAITEQDKSTKQETTPEEPMKDIDQEEDLPLQTAQTEEESIMEDVLTQIPLLRDMMSYLGRAYRSSTVITEQDLDLMPEINNLKTKDEFLKLNSKNSQKQIEKDYQNQIGVIKKLLKIIDRFSLAEVQKEMSEEEKALVKKLKRLAEIQSKKSNVKE